MLKKWLIEKCVTLLVGAIALGIGIWYLSSSIGGASLSYTSVDAFLQQVGVQNGSIATANGCFLCFYIEKLFAVIGDGTELFWNGIVRNLWILMAIGFGIFIIFHTLTYIREQATSKDIKDLSDKEPKLDFEKWFEKVWKTGIRVIVAGVLIGALNWGGTAPLKLVTQITVTPVMYVGTELSMLATGVISGSECNIDIEKTDAYDDVLSPVLKPFMCVMGNLNTVMLAGAGGGFALMNYAWLGLGGGVFTWIAGLLLVVMFLVIGFDLLFKVLNVVFKLVLIIIFMPMLIASSAFQEVWKLAKGLTDTAINTIINCAVSILKISINITIIYAVVYYAADQYYPSPKDGFTSILPPLMGQITPQNTDAKTMSVMSVFSTCEKVSLIDGEMDKDKFLSCFKTQRSLVEQKYPGAFDFMNDGFDFLMFMIGIFFLYYWVISPQVDKLLAGGKEDKVKFDYGQWLKDVGITVYNAPEKIYKGLRDKMKQG